MLISILCFIYGTQSICDELWKRYNYKLSPKQNFFINYYANSEGAKQIRLFSKSKSPKYLYLKINNGLL